MRHRSTTLARGGRPAVPTWLVAVEGLLGLLVTLLGAFEGRLVVLLLGLVAHLVATFCLLVRTLS
jgi:hypothetical protein